MYQRLTAMRNCPPRRLESRLFAEWHGSYPNIVLTISEMNRSRPRSSVGRAAATPPGCPVPKDFSRLSASAPRTSPIGMRSGRNRSDEGTRSKSDAAPSLVRSATRFGTAHCSSRVSSISTTPSPVLATSARSALTSVVLPVEVPPATRMFLRSRTDCSSSACLTPGWAMAPGLVHTPALRRLLSSKQDSCRQGKMGMDQVRDAGRA
jgi:hypothetical protein